MSKGRTGTGVLFMIGATQIVPFMDGFAKYLSPRYSPWQLTWSRFVVHLAVLLPILILRFDRRELWPQKPLLQIARGGFLTLATALFFAALARTPLADVLALFFCYPFLVALLSPWLLGERFDSSLGAAWRTAAGCRRRSTAPASAWLPWFVTFRFSPHSGRLHYRPTRGEFGDPAKARQGGSC